MRGLLSRSWDDARTPRVRSWWVLAPALASGQVRSVELAVLGGASAERYGGDGGSVALSGDGRHAIVGSAHDARIYAADGDAWYEVRHCEAPNDRGHHHPATVAMSADGLTALVAWPYHRSAPGIAYVFCRDGIAWTPDGTISVPDAARAEFGAAMALSDDGRVAVIGAPRADVGGVRRAGDAHVFRWDGVQWIREALLVSPTPTSGDRTGSAVAIDAQGDVVLLGAPNADVRGRGDAGAAYLFERGSAFERATVLESARPNRSDQFGASVALSGDGRAILVGAYRADRDGPNAGAIHPFALRGPEWIRAPSVTVDGAGAIELGRTIAMSRDGQRAVVGANRSPLALILLRADAEGARWREGGWLSPEAIEGGVRAASLSGDGTVALLGAPVDRVHGHDESGTARVLALSDAAGQVTPAPSVDPDRPLELRAELDARRDEAVARSTATLLLMTPLLGALAAYGWVLPEVVGIIERGGPLEDLVYGYVLGVFPLLAVLVTPAAVTALGSLMGGHGDYRGALAGSAIGAALGIGLGLGGYALSRADAGEVRDGFFIGGCVLGALSLGVGAVLGDALWDESERSEPSDVLLVPLVELSPDRGVLGVRGTF